MENISYIGLSNQVALKQMMDIVANNVANMSTPGYQAKDVMFSEYLQDTKGGDKGRDTVSMVLDYRTFRRLDPGPLQQTGNDLDFAIDGRGYFAVTTPEGTRYTRAGSFMLDADRRVVTPEGYALQAQGGGDLVVDAEATNITLTKEGLLLASTGEIGQINIATFEDENALVETGSQLYDAGGQQARPAEGVRVLQGMREGSNVQPIVEMNKMIEILRQYQSMQRIMQGDHERIRKTIEHLTKV